jgi:hypothetical protein
MDWIASIYLLVGTYLLSQKIRFGWVFNVVGSGIFIFYWWLVIWKPAVIVLNLVFCILGVRGYFKWRKN